MVNEIKEMIVWVKFFIYYSRILIFLPFSGIPDPRSPIPNPRSWFSSINLKVLLIKIVFFSATEVITCSEVINAFMR